MFVIFLQLSKLDYLNFMTFVPGNVSSPGLVCWQGRCAYPAYSQPLFKSASSISIKLVTAYIPCSPVE